MSDARAKVTARHLARDAYLYVRQSTLRQVVENAESTRRQYGLRDRAVALGWARDRVVVIDSDLGQSGANRERTGFQRLVADVGMGLAGIVLGLEVSRLARNSSDWHRLLELCALSDTLILDEDGLYNPNDFNDRLLLGLKGQMSEAELHLLRARLQGGILHQARRGELKVTLPVGLVYDPLDRVVLDPDTQVQGSLRTLFDVFEQMGSARAVVMHFRREHMRFPLRLRSGPHKGELAWRALTHERVLDVLHNPRYAGAFVYGRTGRRPGPNGLTYRSLPQDEWTAFIPDAHHGYIDWEQFERHQQQLRANARSYGHDRREGPPREGSALLQGIAVCGRCGRRMTIRYHVRGGIPVPEYRCARESIQTGSTKCQVIPGASVERAVSQLLVNAMTATSIDLALKVHDELQARTAEADAWRDQTVQRAQHEADLAQQRFMATHPHNRLVADVLEAEWNAKLRILDDARLTCERHRQSTRQRLDDHHRARVLELAHDFPRLWTSPATPHRERKRMARLLLEDVTLTRDTDVHLGIRMRGGTIHELRVPVDPPAYQKYATPQAVVDLIDELLHQHNDQEIATRLNDRDMKTGHGLPFTAARVRDIRRSHDLATLESRLRVRGWLTRGDMATKLNVNPSTVTSWSQHGLIAAKRCNSTCHCLYKLLAAHPPPKQQGKKLAQRAADANLPSELGSEV